MQKIIAPINPTTTQTDAISNLQDVLQFLVRIIGCAMKVHNKMEPEFQEVIYQRCLAIQLERLGLSLVREQEQIVSSKRARAAPILSLRIQTVEEHCKF